MTDPDDPGTFYIPVQLRLHKGRAKVILSLTRGEKVSAILALLAKLEGESRTVHSLINTILVLGLFVGPSNT
jgi:hypothetical protein